MKNEDKADHDCRRGSKVTAAVLDILACRSLVSLANFFTCKLATKDVRQCFI